LTLCSDTRDLGLSRASPPAQFFRALAVTVADRYTLVARRRQEYAEHAWGLVTTCPGIGMATACHAPPRPIVISSTRTATGVALPDITPAQGGRQ